MKAQQMFGFFSIDRVGRRNARLRALSAATAVAAMSGCVMLPQQKMAPLEPMITMGPAVRENVTPMEPVLACFGDHIAASKQAPLVIGVGDVKDYTGKYNINEGNAITQGGALMVYSALGKLGGVVQVAERYDPVVAERELNYADRRQLGDGQAHRLGGPNGGQTVPWLPYFGGSINKSDYFIVGGITELNYNLSSGGAHLAVNQVGASARTFSQSVGVDLRIVDTRTLMVVKTVSLTKVFNGYEVDLNVFRFFNSNLFDIDIGTKGQEPLQLGIRAALEEGVVRLVGAVTKVNPQPCLAMRSTDGLPMTPAGQMRKVPNPVAAAATVPVPGVEAVNALHPVGMPASGGSSVSIPFGFGAATLSGGALTLVDQIAAAPAKTAIEVVLLARDTENWDSGKRDALLDQRIGLVRSALADRGIAAGAVSVTWRPDKTDNSIHRDGAGLLEIARLRVEGGSSAAAKEILKEGVARQ
ncbi:CsgG/HfaB family protein [Variovorax sp. J22R133]|uniref:CsgG/HfaB family protein n=1 Tax=Variovorax brevis TaxID=3053503 RepID=UPI002575C19A|nr:CsgG/HfaB family protein [Variovorax sp. J22R133]MDM0117589.1 CsgG/HfaB family protein [Variovorax sp. J22R133]